MQVAQLQERIKECERQNSELKAQIKAEYTLFTTNREQEKTDVNAPIAYNPHEPTVDDRVMAYCEWMDPMQPSPAIDIRSTEAAVLAESKTKTEYGSTVFQGKLPHFTDVHPNYRKEDDVWERTLNLRILDEAVRGDVSQPMPAPVVFAEDFDNYREGKYVKDDCWIA